MKDEVKIYVYDKLDKKIIKIYYFYYLNVRTFSTITYYFKETTTILHYQQHKTFLFSTIYIYTRMSELFLLKLTILHIKLFINLS